MSLLKEILLILMILKSKIKRVLHMLVSYFLKNYYVYIVWLFMYISFPYMRVI